MFNDIPGLERLVKMIRAYFKEGGLQLQISVAGQREMRDAQLHPENHENLIVRIGGYSEFFTRLDKELQDAIMERTEYEL
jgi:formate C-acetyltransferase